MISCQKMMDPSIGGKRSEPYDLNWCRRKRFPTANIVHLLKQRELGVRREGSHFVNGSREFYHSLRIERAEHSVERPKFFPLRFTPDGSRLVGISPNLQEIYVFTYRGVQFGNGREARELFSAIFPRHLVVQFWDPRVDTRAPERLLFGLLSKDCALITPDSRFLIVSATILIPEHRSIFDGIFRNFESMEPDSNLVNITFYSIDLKKGLVMDKHRFEFDEISVQNGVYLLEWTLAILSVRHQTIHLLGIDKSSGSFIPLKQIGPSMLDDDQLWEGGLAQPRGGQVFTAFRQRLLTFLYREWAAKGQVKQFLCDVDYYKRMKMQKIQFVGPELILIRLELHPHSNNDASSAQQQQQQQFMFVLLDWRRGEIVGAYSRCSEQLFHIFEQHHEYLKNGHLPSSHFPTTMEHCGHARSLHDYYMQSFSYSLSETDSRRRCLNSLPYANYQHLSSSPLLDPEMFSYDDQFRLVGFLEKGRFPLEKPLILFSRRTKTCHSRLEFYPSTQRVFPSCYARVLFHPIDPFVISTSRGNQPEHLISFYMPSPVPKEEEKADENECSSSNSNLDTDRDTDRSTMDTDRDHDPFSSLLSFINSDGTDD